MPSFLRSGLLLASMCFLLPASSRAQNYTINEELMYRINFGRTDDVRLLLSRGANPNAHNVQGDSTLSVAIDRQDSEALTMVEALLDKGANPNVTNSAGVYPIMRAVANDQPELVAALIQHGAEYDIRNNKNVLLIDLARQGRDATVVGLLQQVIDEKATYEANLRSPGRFKTVVRFYRFHSCRYQYWNYYKGSRQEPERDKDSDRKIDAEKVILADLLRQVQKYFPSTRTSYLEQISNDAASQIYGYLDGLISNRNRAEHGVGSEKDADSRCWKIAGPAE